MAAKLVLSDVTSGNAGSTLINTNNAAIEAIVEKAWMLDGTGDNIATAALDMNGNNINNLGNPIEITGWVWEGPWVTATAYTVGDVIEDGGSSYICIEAHTSGTFSTDLTAVKWQLTASASLPSQTGNSGKFLTTDGTTASWGTVATTYLALAGGTLVGGLVSVGITDTGIVDLSGATIAGGTPLVFEGTTADAFETSLVITDPTVDRTLTVPDADVDLTKVRTASTTLDGVVELATSAEMTTGTDSTRATTIQSIRQGLVWQSDITTLSGTSTDITGIPSWITCFDLIFYNISSDSTNSHMIQIGDAGGMEATGYISASNVHSTVTANLNTTTGFRMYHVTAARGFSGIISFRLYDPDTFQWIMSGVGTNELGSGTYTYGGIKSLSAALTQIRMTTLSGSASFDSGTFKIMGW